MFKTIKMFLVGLSAIVLSTSCANEFDVVMVENQMAAEVAIAQAKADAVIAQSEAIAVTVTDDMSDLERYFARLSIAGLEVTPSGIKSVTTGNDVLISITADGKTIVRDIVTGTVLYKGAGVVGEIFKSAGGNETHITGDGNTTSLVDEDVKLVNIGEGSQAYKTGGGASGDEEYDTCEQAVQAAEEECDMNINLGAVMTCLSTESGCSVDIADKTVLIDGEFPHHELNSKWSCHPDLGGLGCDGEEAAE